MDVFVKIIILNKKCRSKDRKFFKAQVQKNLILAKKFLGNYLSSFRCRWNVTTFSAEFGKIQWKSISFVLAPTGSYLAKNSFENTSTLSFNLAVVRCTPFAFHDVLRYITIFCFICRRHTTFKKWKLFRC